ncbi:MAG: response regulator [Lachnospiraceae bacterium]|nr:response regulator [Lachnospiraceae bacterium]
MDELKLTDILNPNILQKIQDAFSAMAGLSALTTDENGIPVTNGSNFTRFCKDMVRTCKEGSARCEECAKMGAVKTLETGHFSTYYCHSGLVDFAAPIMVENRMIGAIIGGQVLSEPPNEEIVRAVAEELSLNADLLWETAQEIPVMPREQIDARAKAIYRFAEVVSEMAYGRYLAEKASKEMEHAITMKSDFLANMSHEIRTPMNAVIGLAEMALREEMSPVAREYVNQIKSSGRALLNIINDILDFSKIESGKLDIIPMEYETLSIINDVSNIILVKLKEKEVELLLDVNPHFPATVEGDNLRIKQILTNLANNAVKFTHTGYVRLSMDYEPLDDETIAIVFRVEDTGIGIKEQDIDKLFQSFNQVDSKRNRNIEGTGLGLAISKQLVALMDGEIRVDSTYGKGSTFSFKIPQKVIDWRKSVTVEDAGQIYVMGRFANSDIEKQFRCDLMRLGIEYECAGDWQQVAERLEEYQDTKEKRIFVFTEKACRNEELQYILEHYLHMTIVMIDNFFSDEKSDRPNLRLVKKPLSPIKIAMVLNDEELTEQDHSMDAFAIDFVAPDAKILIVDDNDMNLTVAEGLLEPIGMKVVAVTSGKEALQRIAHERFDLIFMDHMMPELDGVETTRLIRRFHPECDDIPIIALTANAVSGTREMFLSEGMNDFVPKPVEVRLFASKVKQWLPADKVRKRTAQDLEAVRNRANGIPDFDSGLLADLDTDTARQMLGNDKLFFNILKEYHGNIETKAKMIEMHVEGEDWHAYTIMVHALKSASKQIGAMELSELAAELEKAGNVGDIDKIRDKTQGMLEKYRSYIDLLQPFFDNAGAKEEAEKATAKPEELEHLFGRLLMAAEDLDMDGMEEVGEGLDAFAYEGEQAFLYEALSSAIKGLDVETCEEVIERWRQIL